MNVRVETDWVHIHHDGVLFQVGFSASDHIILTTSRNGAPRNLYILDPDSHEFEVAESEPAAPDATEARFSPAPQPRPEGKESPYAIVYGHRVEIFCGDMVIKFLFTPDLGVLTTLSRGLDRPRLSHYALRPDSSELQFTHTSGPHVRFRHYRADSGSGHPWNPSDGLGRP